jgi:hypothetical protein
VNLRPRLIVFVAVIGLLVWVMGDALLGSGTFVFRDAAHFYYPLFQFTADEWAAGRVPLWNPYENLGQPLAGNPAASVFYPGKLIFALPISYPWAYKIYIMGHLLLAAWAAYRLARHWQASVEAAGLCAVSYAFSGNVLFTYCNVVFLVGAAWLPLAVLSADRMLTGGRAEGRKAEGGRGRVRWAVLFGVVLAMMVLGGDPQMAYNAVLLAAMYALMLWIAHKRSCKAATSGRGTAVAATHRAATPSATGGGFTVGLSYLWPLALAALVGLALSAVQVLPSMEFTRHSDRLPGPLADRLLGRVEPETHAEHTYHFSVGPWRLAEYLWPNLSGRQFPVHRRWLDVIPAEGRIWTPSFYMGLLPLLLALSAMRFRRRQLREASPRSQSEPRDRWLSWSVVLAVVASFGWYGLGWLVDEVRFAAGADPADLGLVGGPLGGLYWLMTLLLPGYAYFRYPAKLLVVAALGLSLLSARGFDRVFSEPADRFRRGLLWLGGLSLCGAIAALAIRPCWKGWLGGVEPDPLFGPLDTTGAANDLLAALLQTAVLCGLSWWLLGQAAPRARWVPVVALLLSAVDLGVANRWLVVTAPVTQWQEPSKLAAVLQRKAPGDRRPYRVLRDAFWTPPAWKAKGSPDRLADAMRWDLDTLFPKYNLSDRIPSAQVQGTMMPGDYAELLRSANMASVPLSLAKYVILPGDRVLPEGERIEVDVEDVSLWYNPRHLSRTWISDQLDGRPRALAGESCRVMHYDPLKVDPLKVEIEAELSRPGLVVLSDQFYRGWKLEVETQRQPPRPHPILRTDRVMRGVWLPEGHHLLTYRYRPASFTCGAIISGLAWIGVIFGLASILRSRRTRRP